MTVTTLPIDQPARPSARDCVIKNLEEKNPRIALARFENFEAHTPAQRAALEVAQQYAEEAREWNHGGDWLYLAGFAGTGKTHLAAAATIAIGCWGTQFVTASELIDEIKKSFTRRYTDEPTTEDIKRKYIDARLLVIDDLGAGQRGTEFESALLSDLLCERYRGTWPTIITTNLVGSQMTEFLGQRVVDRLEEVARKAEFTWDSYRRGSRRRRGMP